MSDTSYHRDSFVVERATEGLSALRKSCRSIVFATVATEDGFVVATFGEGSVQSSSMGGMASSMQALSDAVSRELNIGETQYVIISSERGNLVQLRISGYPLVLSALFDLKETVGKALSESRASAQKIAHSLRLAA